MNHLQLFKYVQENHDKFNFEVRSMMRTINNETDLKKIKSDLLLLIKFVDLKIKDTDRSKLMDVSELLRLTHE